MIGKTSKINKNNKIYKLLIIIASISSCVCAEELSLLKFSDLEMSKIINERSHLIQKLENNYNVNFLPETQLISLRSKYIDLDFNITKKQYIENINFQPYPFYIDFYRESLVIVDRQSRLFLINLNELDQSPIKKIKLDKHIIKGDISDNNIFVLDSFINEGSIYISYSYGSPSCKRMGIIRSKLPPNKISFENIFSPEECSRVIMGGRMGAINSEGADGLLITTSSEDNENPDLRAQNLYSIYGKILFIDLQTLKHVNYSIGHRNSQGLYIGVDGVIIETEHGPRGGDEINFIKKGRNYGWPIASYGEKYGEKESQPTFKKEHLEHGFEEPIYSFVPSIAISEIVKIPINFNIFWERDFLIASLNKKSIFRVRFSKDYSKVILVEPIYIGSRVRDMKFSPDGKKLYLALEMPNQIMVLSPQ